MRELILGGARSGKSVLAAQRATACRLAVSVIVTASAGDPEMAERIARHRAARPAEWRVIEEPMAIGAALAAECAPDRVVIIDCLTLWLSNLLLAKSPFAAEREALLEALRESSGTVLLVANEVG